MFIVKNPFLFALLGLAFSMVYLPLYIRTRNAEGLREDVSRRLHYLLPACLLFNWGTALFSPQFSGGKTGKLFLLLLMLIADVDLLIRKLPTEFLLLLFAAAAAKLVSAGFPPQTLLSVLCFSLWWIARKKKIIGLYDVLMILALTLFLQQTQRVLLFYALVLILWGLFGLILKQIFKKKPQTLIPLCPLIIAAFLLTQLFP